MLFRHPARSDGVVHDSIGEFSTSGSEPTDYWDNGQFVSQAISTNMLSGFDFGTDCYLFTHDSIDDILRHIRSEHYIQLGRPEWYNIHSLESTKLDHNH